MPSSTLRSMPPEKQSQYTPIDEVQSDVVHIHIPFPAGCDASQIGIDIIRLETLCNLAGIINLNIGSTKEDSNGVKTLVLGVNRDGSAVGGATKSATKSESKHVITKSNDKKRTWPISTSIELDMRELTDHIARTYPEGIRSSIGWATELNSIIKEEIRTQGGEFLLAFEKNDVVDELLIILGLSMTYLTYHVLKYQKLPIPGNIMLSEVVATIAIGIKYMVNLPILNLAYLGYLALVGKKPRLSMLHFGGSEPDRALVLFGTILATRQLVAVIQPEKE